MATSLFGVSIKVPNDDNQLQSFATPVTDDGAVVVSTSGSLGTVVDIDGAIKSEAELVTKYREMSFHAEIDSAIQDIVNEAIVMNDEENIVEIILDDVRIPDRIKKIIEEEFNTVKELLEFNTNAYNIFERFYIDGRLYFNAIINPKKSAEGIQRLQYIDPRKIRKIRETKPKSNTQTYSSVPNAQDIEVTRKEYYLYNEQGFGPATNQGPSGVGYTPPTTGLKIAKDSIIHITSGRVDNSIRGGLVLSYLHLAIKPLNQLRSLEDSAIIYRISRAPERRIFYIDTGNLPKIKAEQHIREMMVKYKNKLVYDPNTGEIRDSRKFMTMLEDFWFSRREGGKGTEVDTLQSGNVTGVMEEVEFFQKKLYKALKVPFSRFSEDTAFSLGRDTQISRDEIKFSAFIDQMRLRFNQLFLKTLRMQLILKNIIKPSDWRTIAAQIKFRYARNNIFTELKIAEIQMDRLQRLQLADHFAGKYFSHKWIRKNILNQTDQEIDQIDQENVDEMQSVMYNPAKVLTAQPGQPGQLALPPPDGQNPQQDQDEQQPEQNSDDQAKGDQNQPSVNMYHLKQQVKRAADAKNSKDNKKINKTIPKKKPGKRNGR